MCAEVWIGLVNVSPYQNESYDFDGAYVNILCLASNYDDYIEKVKHALIQEKMNLIESSKIEPFKHRKLKFILTNDLMELAEDVELTGNVSFSTFHTYDAKNEN